MAMRRRLLAVFALLALVAAACGNDEKPVAGSAGTCTIGRTMDFTKSVAELTKQIDQGMDLALKERVDPKWAINVVDVDTQFDPAKSVAGLNKLVDVDKAAVIFSQGSGQMTAQSPIAKQRGVVLFNVAANSPAMHKWWSENGAFSVINDSATQVAGLAPLAVQKLGLKTFGTIYIKGAYGDPQNEAFKREVEKAGGQVTVETTVDGFTVTDYRANWSKIVQKQPDAVLLMLVDTAMTPVLQQALDAGYKGKMLVAEGHISATSVKNSGALMERWAIIGTGQFIADKPATETARRFTDSFTKEYGQEPAGTFQLAGYDAMRVVSQAIEEVGCDSAKIHDNIAGQTSFEGVSGVLDFSKGAPQAPPILITVKGSEIIPFEA